MNLEITKKDSQVLSQLIYRINQSVNYTEFAEVVSSRLKKLIPFRKFLCIRVSEMDHVLSAYDPYIPDKTRSSYEIALYGIHSGDFWTKYLYAPWSSVFRISDLQNPIRWERSYLYNYIYAPQGLYYSLQTVLIHSGLKLGAICLYRSAQDGDFTEWEVGILELLKAHLELKLFRLLNRERGFTLEPDPLAPQFIFSSANAVQYHLTRREEEIIERLLIGESDPEICQNLCITKSTLDKHIHNIYKKTGTRTRITLFQKFKS